MQLRSAALLLLASACATTPQGVRPDVLATDSVRLDEPDRFVSPRAYRNYLEGLLARGNDDYAAAAKALREALIYDPESAHLHTVLADVLLRQGRVAEGEEQLRAALVLDPSHAPARLLLARVSMARDRPTEARAHLRAAVEAAPGEPEAYRELVRVELAGGDLASAQAVAAKLSAATLEAQKRAALDQEGDARWTAQRLADGAAAVWVDLARASANRRDDAGATAAFAAARAASPSDPEALSAEAAFLEARRKFAPARELQLRLLAQRPESPEVLSALARLALEDGDLDSAGAHARKLLGLAAGIDPWKGPETGRDEERREIARALLRIAVPLLGARRSAESQAALEGALRLYPGHPELAFYRALALVQRGHAREAARVFEQVDKALQDPAPMPSFLGAEPQALALDARVQAAVARGKAGEHAEACRRIKAIFAEFPLDDSAPLALLDIHERAGRTAEAEQLLADAVRGHPGAETLLYALASTQDRLGQRERALSTMRKVLAVNPQHVGALNFVGYTLTEEGSPAALAEAEDLLARAVELRPDDGAVADSYGFCLLRLGRAAPALVELRRADGLSPNDPVILSHLGDALLANGLREEALRAFRNALSRLQPAHTSAREHRSAAVDPLERSPDAGDEKVRVELLRKVQSLTHP